MKKLLILLSLLQITLFGYEYDFLTIKAQSTIFPKLILLDQNIANKLVDDYVLFSVVYDQDDKREAQKIKELIEKQYGDTLGKYKLKVIIQHYKELENQKSTAYYILNSKDSLMQKVSQIGMNNSLIVYSYDKNYFQNDVLISLAIKGSTIIYFNKKMLKNYNINFVDALYQIVKFENGK